MKYITPKTIIITFIITFALVIVTILAIFIPRAGKVAVEIQAVPKNTTITIDGAQVKAGIIYLAPGEYTIKGTAEGYAEDQEYVVVGDEEVLVGILPEPVSEEAQKYISENTDVQADREALAGINANRNGSQIRTANPIIEKLPYIDPKSLYAIDYGITNETPSHFFILIGNSSPEGRANALKWLQQQNVDISTTDIRYDDFVNPLLGVSN